MDESSSGAVQSEAILNEINEMHSQNIAVAHAPTHPAALPGKAQAQKIAHWPALLEAWLSASEKQRFVLDSGENHTSVDFWVDL